jgi:hypothetical protein
VSAGSSASILCPLEQGLSHSYCVNGDRAYLARIQQCPAHNGSIAEVLRMKLQGKLFVKALCGGVLSSNPGDTLATMTLLKSVVQCRESYFNHSIRKQFNLSYFE